MEERNITEEKASAATASASDAGETIDGEGVRVTDRRRITIDEATGEVRSTGSGDARSGTGRANFKPAYVEELEARTHAAEQKMLDVQARFEQVRRELQQETDAIRQRLNRAADERAMREKAQFVNALLPVLDNLQRAVQATDQGGTLEALLDGLHGTINGFENALSNVGVESIESLGTAFDPQLHEAVDTTEVEPAQDGFITAEYARGYRIGDQLLRPARVKVGHAK